MNKILKQSLDIILENTRESLISLYTIGSVVTKDMEDSSDIDFVGVFKDDFDFRKEKQINKLLNQKIKSRHRLDLGTMSIKEFYGGKRRGSLMKYIELPIFLNFLKNNAKLIYGKKLNFDRFPTKPAPLKEELKYHMKMFKKYKKDFRTKDKLGPDFDFKGFLKMVFYIANIELQITRKMRRRKSYNDIIKAFNKDKEHIVHETMRLRKKKNITNKEKQKWLDKAQEYVKTLKWLTLDKKRR